jgi:hypothetical protein
MVLAAREIEELEHETTSGHAGGLHVTLHEFVGDLVVALRVAEALIVLKHAYGTHNCGRKPEHGPNGREGEFPRRWLERDQSGRG